LAITQMKSYYQTHHDDTCADIRAMCCYCCCPPRPPTKSCDVTDREAQHSEPGETASCEARQSPTGCFTKCVGHSPISEYERSIYLHTEAIRKQIVTVSLIDELLHSSPSLFLSVVVFVFFFPSSLSPICFYFVLLISLYFVSCCLSSFYYLLNRLFLYQRLLLENHTVWGIIPQRPHQVKTSRSSSSRHLVD